MDNELLEAILRAIQNALIYGYRIRFLHSLAYNVATLPRPHELLKGVWKSMRLGVDHGKILAVFAIVFRVVKTVLKRRVDKPVADFIAGFLGGCLVYGGLVNRRRRMLNDAILQQITMYTLSRLVLALGRDVANAAVPDRYRKKARDMSWTLGCGLVWGGIMLYYRRDGGKDEYLPRAMRVSLDFIYGSVPHAWREAFQYGREDKKRTS